MTQMIGQENVGMEIEDTLCLDAEPRPIWKLIDKCVECFEEDEKHYLLNYLLTWHVRKKEKFSVVLIY